MAVVDLGQQHLKDVQHERIYQLAIDGDQSFPPLKTETPKSASDELGDRISRHVEEMVEKSLNPAARFDREVEGARWTRSGTSRST